MNQIVLQRKLTAPNGSNLLNRPQLVEKLSKYCQSPLTVISAPAGYGKTSLVSDWGRYAQHPIFWLSLDEQNNLPTSFWLHLCACLKKIDASLACAAEQMLETHFVEDYCHICDLVLASLEQLSQKWSCPNKAVIVLDDFQYINHPDIIKSFNRFIDYLPNWLQLVITSRTLPQLMLPNRCSKSQANLIQADELTFDHQQVSEFLALKLELHLNQQDIETLLGHTEGWAAAIQLTGLALKSGSSIEDCRQTQDSLLADFLLQEVFSQLEPELQQLLLELSFSDYFTLELCQRFNPARDNLALLDKLTSQGLFVTKEAFPNDNLKDTLKTSSSAKEIYRIHSLLRQWLKDNNPHEPEAIHNNQQRILTWLIEQEEYAQAIELSLKLEQWPICAELVAKRYPSLIHIKHFDLIEDILNRIPKEVMPSLPNLCLLSGLIQFTRYDYAKVLEYTSYIDHFFSQSQSDFHPQQVLDLQLGSLVLQAQVARYSGQLQLAQAINVKIHSNFETSHHELHCWILLGQGIDAFFNDDIQCALDLCQQALEQAQKSEDVLCSVSALGWLLHALFHNGNIQQALFLAKENLTWLQHKDFSSLPNASSVYAAITILYAENNQLDLAWQHYQLLTGCINSFTDPREVIYNKFHSQFHLLLSCGQLQAAENCLHELKQYENSLAIKPNSQTSILLDTHTLSILLESRKGNQFPLIQYSSEYSKHQFRSQFEQMIYHSGQMLMTGDPQALIELGEHSGTNGNHNRELACYLVAAKISLSKDDTSQALKLFQQVIRLAKRHQFINLIIEDKTACLGLIKLASEHKLEAEYCQLLKNALQHRETWLHSQTFDNPIYDKQPLKQSIKVDGKVSASTRSNKEHSLLNTLSPREREVLQLIQQGHRNQQVAELLSLSPSTVKRHLQNIYQKLQVNSRTEAIALL
jgi:LuxR family maltose regulon positive regulatory protein